MDIITFINKDSKSPQLDIRITHIVVDADLDIFVTCGRVLTPCFIFQIRGLGGQCQIHVICTIETVPRVPLPRQVNGRPGDAEF